MTEADRLLRDHVALVARAAHLAARLHADQRRKGAAREPYVNHLAEVASLLATTAEGPDPHLVAAGWLHDALEDTPTTFAEIERQFGPVVAGLVAEVTDDRSLPKDERKRLQVANAPGKSPGAQAIKIADKISNLRAIASSPPEDWSPERRRDYIDWAQRVVDGCHGANAELKARFAHAAARARETL